MKILFYTYPGILPLGPQLNAAWSALFCRLCTTLAGTGEGQYCVISGKRFQTTLTSLPDIVRVGLIDEQKLHAAISRVAPVAATPSVLTWLADHEQDCSHPAIALLSDEIQTATQGFQPDIVVTFSIQAHYLKTIWPHTVIMYVEAGSFSRSPYPFSLFFDHLGMYRSSAPALLSPTSIASTVKQESVDTFLQFSAWSQQVLKKTNPFDHCDLKRGYDCLVLFPLQVSHYHSFEEHTHHTTQFEYLFDFLVHTPPEVGVVVTEYVQWGNIVEDEGPKENLAYLKQVFPNLIFVKTFRKILSPSQYVISAVDAVWTVVSNLGYQALLAGRRLGTSPRSYLSNVAHNHSFTHFYKELGRPAEDQSWFLAWYLQNYLVPELVLNDGNQLFDYFKRRLEAAHNTTDVLEQFVPIGPVSLLRQAWIPPRADSDTTAIPYVSHHAQKIHKRVCAENKLTIAQMQQQSMLTLLAKPAFPVENPTRYVLLNATDQIEHGLHLGCNAVTRFLLSAFAEQGFLLHGIANTAAQCASLADIPLFRDVSLVVFNGADSLHHDNERCKGLLNFCEAMKAQGCRCVLINSVWHENSESFSQYLNVFDLIAVRESRSLWAVSRWRPDARKVPDMSFAAFREKLPGLVVDPLKIDFKTSLSVIDSVIAWKAGALADFAEFHEFPFFLMGPSNLDTLVKPLAAGYEVAGEVFPRILSNHCDVLVAESCLTGRFHGLVASLVCGVKTVCLPSNTPKIEGLLEDFGIIERALLPEGWLKCGHNSRLEQVEALLAKWDDRTLQRIQEQTIQAVAEIRQLFCDIKELTRL